jgi:site-specific recombinase XerD
MDALLARYESDRLAVLSDDRGRASLRVLRDLQARCDRADLARAEAGTVRRLLEAWEAAGAHPNTARKWRGMILAFYGWAWREGYITGDVLLELRAIRPPNGSYARAQPEPYRPGELRELRPVLDERWPRLPDDEARRWVGRWRDGLSPYSRIRQHAIRLQLEAVLALALHCGLRRGEIFRLDVEAIHPDNAYIVVPDKDGPWPGAHHIVHYTDSAREAIAPWVRLRAAIKPDHSCAWLNLWSAETVREPMTRHSFDRLLRTYVGRGWSLRRLRATCIVNWIRAGLKLEHLRDVLGYSDIAELLPYARCVGGDPGREMDRLDASFCAGIGVAPAAA